MKLQNVKTLAALADLLNTQSAKGIDLSDLPTFGGTPPKNTSEVFSWDETHILASDWTIAERCECGEAYFHCDCN